MKGGEEEGEVGRGEIRLMQQAGGAKKKEGEKNKVTADGGERRNKGQKV